MAALNYAQLYEQAIDQKYTGGVYFNELYTIGDANARNRFKFMGGNVVNVNTITVSGMTAHNRDTVGTKGRSYDNAWKAYTLAHDRKWNTLIDPADIDETNMTTSIANITSVFTKEELFPEMDKKMSSELHEQGTQYNTTSLPVTTAAEVLTAFDTLMEAMDEAEVPDENRVLYVTPAIDRLLKEALSPSRKLGTTISITNVNRIISILDNVKRVKVPSTRMNTSYDYTLGAVADGEQIHMILVHPESVVAPFKIDEVYIDAPSAKSDGKYDYYQRKYWEVFVFEQKKVGVQALATTAV